MASRGAMEAYIKEKDSNYCLPSPVDSICGWNILLLFVLLIVLILFSISRPKQNTTRTDQPTIIDTTHDAAKGKSDKQKRGKTSSKKD